MGAIKHFAEDISTILGYDGEITEAVSEVATALLKISERCNLDLEVTEDKIVLSKRQGTDLCDLCMMSGVTANRTTYCGKTIGVECGCDDGDGTCCDPDCEACGNR